MYTIEPLCSSAICLIDFFSKVQWLSEIVFTVMLGVENPS
jgi:hypothetical protein